MERIFLQAISPDAPYQSILILKITIDYLQTGAENYEKDKLVVTYFFYSAMCIVDGRFKIMSTCEIEQISHMYRTN